MVLSKYYLTFWIIKKRFAYEKDRKTILGVWGNEKKCQGTRKKEEKFSNSPIRDSENNSRIIELENW